MPFRHDDIVVAVCDPGLDVDTLVGAPEEEVKVLGQAYAVYQRQLEEENALDFSTIQYEALRLLRAHPEILGELQKQITYLMVDEYQDTNTIQEMILTLLAGDNPNLCVVGDDDQGLYRFRGATIRSTASRGTTARGDTIRGTAIRGTAIRGTTVRSTAIRSAAICGTAICRTTICGTTVSGTTICSATIRGTAVRGAAIRSTAICGATIRSATICSAAIRGTTIRRGANSLTSNGSLQFQLLIAFNAKDSRIGGQFCGGNGSGGTNDESVD